MRRLYSVSTGLVLGIMLALLFPAGVAYIGWLGQIFLSLLKLLILPLILVSIYASLSGGRDLRLIGGRALLYYALTSASAATLGTVLGLVVCYVQIHYQVFPLDPTVYIIPAIPVEIRWTDFVAVSLASMLLSTIASLYPARRAARLLPVEAIRWE